MFGQSNTPFGGGGGGFGQTNTPAFGSPAPGGFGAPAPAFGESVFRVDCVESVLLNAHQIIAARWHCFLYC